jgi:hypothetical protein
MSIASNGSIFLLLFFSCCSHLEHRASVKLFVSLQFLNPKTVGMAPWTGEQPVARLLPAHEHRINSDKHPYLEWGSNP